MHRTSLPLVLPVAMLFVGCPAPCDSIVTGVTPDDGASDVYARDSIVVKLAAADAGATMTVTSSNGQSEPGDVEVDGTILTFTPTGGLAPSDMHTVTVETCAETFTSTFSTSDVGTPVEDESATLDGAYVLDLETATEAEPSTTPTILQAMSGGTSLTAMVTAVPDDGLDMLAGFVEEDSLTQNFCYEAFELPTADYENPYFSIVDDDFEMPFGEISVSLDLFELSGALASDALSMEEVTMHIVFDTRPLIPVITDDPDAADSYVCDIVADMDAYCVECSDGSGPYCLDILVGGMTAPQSDVELVPWDEDDIAGVDCE